jgi:energy-coupling factor transport system permease protein
MISSALGEVEERTMALEARAFTAPARRTMIRRLPDTTGQRIFRWGLGIAVVVAVAATFSGWLAVP